MDALHGLFFSHQCSFGSSPSLSRPRRFRPPYLQLSQWRILSLYSCTRTITSLAWAVLFAFFNTIQSRTRLGTETALSAWQRPAALLRKETEKTALKLRTEGMVVTLLQRRRSCLKRRNLEAWVEMCHRRDFIKVLLVICGNYTAARRWKSKKES